MGKAIRKGVQFLPIPPTQDDLFPDGARKYSHRANSTNLDSDSRKDYLAATLAFDRNELRRNEEEAKVCALITSSFSEEVKMLLRSNREYVLAADNNDSYGIYTTAKAAHTRVTSFAVAQNTFEHLLQISMTTGTYAAYTDHLLNNRRTFDAIFDPTASGMIPIDNIYTMVLVNGLPESFRYMKDKLYSEDLNGAFPKFDEVRKSMQTYDLNKHKVDVSITPVVPNSPTILAATTDTTSPICNTCNKPFPRTISRTTNKPFTRCISCSYKARNLVPPTVTTPAPTPQQMLAPTQQQITQAQGQLKKAHAVLLAANLNYKVPDPVPAPIIPPPTQRDADYLNSYISSQSNNYSLVATTMIQPSSQWILDSGASLCCTWELSDLINPSLLASPVPIGSAAGETIHATHVGSSAISSSLQIYYVPLSTVKLVSLGALTSLGYVATTGPDQSFSITAPSGVFLCNCLKQTNNIWIFPNSILTRPDFPKPAVTNRNPVPTGATGYPFQIPLNPRHFTKEEVQRAHSMFNLHHFLCHPSDTALKSTLDQGLLSRHTHLTSADVDLMRSFYGSCLACTIGKLSNQDLHTIPRW
jgi:hypothetical protein